MVRSVSQDALGGPWCPTSWKVAGTPGTLATPIFTKRMTPSWVRRTVSEGEELPKGHVRVVFGQGAGAGRVSRWRLRADYEFGPAVEDDDRKCVRQMREIWRGERVRAWSTVEGRRRPRAAAGGVGQHAKRRSRGVMLRGAARRARRGCRTMLRRGDVRCSSERRTG